MFEFFATDNAQKAKSGKRDLLFINEANGVAWSIANQLMIRTRGTIILDWNPSGKYWLSRMILPALKKDDYVFTRTTYRDNTSIEKRVIDSIERLRLIDANLYDIYGMGVEGKGTEVIFPVWELVDEMPDTDKISNGLDFGFTNDPSASIDCALYDGCLWFDEIFYERGLSNKKIYELYKLRRKHYGRVIADSAEPKSIADLFDMGLDIIPCVKGPDSVKFWIDKIKQYPMKVTKRSINLIDELDSAKWIMVDGRPTNKPKEGNDHCIAGMRYGSQGILSNHQPIKMMVKKAASYGFTDMGV